MGYGFNDAGIHLEGSFYQILSVSGGASSFDLQDRPFFLTFFMQFLQSFFHGFYRISFVVVIVGVQDTVIFIKHYYFGGGRAGIYSYGSLLYSGC